MSLRDLVEKTKSVKNTLEKFNTITNSGIITDPTATTLGNSLHNNAPFYPYKENDPEQELLLRRAAIAGFGDIDVAIGAAIRNLSIRSQTALTPQNKEQTGLVLFTRPNCYLNDTSCATDRMLAVLMSTNPRSYHSMIRAYLDPLGQRDNNTDGGPPYIQCDLVDPDNVFMPLLTNTCLELTGWPDPVLDTSDSSPGRRQEVYGITDGIFRIHGKFTLTGVFKNIPRDPVRQILDTWCLYQSNVALGKTFPSLRSIVRKRVNYETRIWRLVLDDNRQFVTRIGCAHRARPLVTDIGRIFDYSSERHAAEATNVSTQFACYGAEYNDPILLDEFNKTSTYFNVPLREKITRNQFFVQLKPSEWQMFDGAYPLIDIDTNELQWWVTKERYEGVMEYYGGSVDKSTTRSAEDKYNDLLRSMNITKRF